MQLLRRTKGGHLHPSQAVTASNTGIAVDQNSRDVARLIGEGLFNYLPMPDDIYTTHVQYDFNSGPDIDLTNTWRVTKEGYGWENLLHFVAPLPDHGDNAPPRAKATIDNHHHDFQTYQDRCAFIYYTQETTAPFPPDVWFTSSIQLSGEGRTFAGIMRDLKEAEDAGDIVYEDGTEYIDLSLTDWKTGVNAQANNHLYPTGFYLKSDGLHGPGSIYFVYSTRRFVRDEADTGFVEATVVVDIFDYNNSEPGGLGVYDVGSVVNVGFYYDANSKQYDVYIGDTHIQVPPTANAEGWGIETFPRGVDMRLTFGTLNENEDGNNCFMYIRRLKSLTPFGAHI